MQEPIQRLQELINAYPHFTEPMRHNVIEGIKASVLTAFYTPKFLVDAVVRQIHATFSENGLKMRSFLEPSAGIGGFLPIAMSGTYDYAIEKDLISGMILSLLHENTLTRTAAFETIGEQGFEHTTFDVIASNIPFGNFRVFDAELWKKGGMYEQATKTIHNYFFVKAMELLNEGGLLAFITSRGIADTPGNKFVREYLVNHADLISAIRLPDMLFMQTSGIEVGSDLLIFQKHTHKTVLSQREQLFLQVGREKADAIGTMTEYANKLFTMPKTTLATGSRIVQNQYGKYVRKYQWQGNENAMSQYLAALLKLDFGRYFRKSLFTGNGQGSEHMQMSLFGNVAMKQVEKGKRAYTDGVEAWMKDGAMVLFEGQVGTIQYRKSSLYQEVAIDFVPVDEGKVNTDRAKDYFPIRKAYFELSIKEREEQKEDNGLRRELNARYDAFVAILSGNNDLLNKTKLDNKIMQLEKEQAIFKKERIRAERKIAACQEEVEKAKRTEADFKRDLEYINSYNGAKATLLLNLPQASTEEVGRELHHIAKTYRNGAYGTVGTYAGLNLLVHSEYNMDGTFDRNTFFVEGISGLKYRCGLSGALPLGFVESAQYPHGALSKLPSLIEKQQKAVERIESEIPTLQKIVCRQWSKTDELSRLKQECKELQHRIDESLKEAEQPQAAKHEAIAEAA